MFEFTIPRKDLFDKSCVRAEEINFPTLKVAGKVNNNIALHGINIQKDYFVCSFLA